MEQVTLKMEWNHPVGWPCAQSTFSISRGNAATIVCAVLGKLVPFLRRWLAFSSFLLRRCPQLNSDADITRNLPLKHRVSLPVSRNRRYHGENLCGQQLA